MGDAAAVVAANPALGIGPDVWRFLYPYVQSAQYTATSVHCGYLQIALDAGVSKIIPHIYSSIIDKVSGNTRPDDVRQLMAMTRACVG